MGITHWIVAQGIAFLLLMVILNRILYKPVLANIRHRDADIDAKHDYAALLHKRASDLKDKYDKELEESEGSAKEMYAQIIGKSKEAAAFMREKAKNEIDDSFHEKSVKLAKKVEIEKGFLAHESDGLLKDILKVIS